MIEKYEKISIDSKTGEMVYEIVAKAEATHKHICYHDEAKSNGQSSSCKRVKL